MRQSKGKLILISGLPGSGKSTCGRKIAEQYHLTYIDYDTVIGSFMAEFYRQGRGEQSYSDLQRQWRSCCYQSFWNLIIENLRSGLPVIGAAPLSSERTDKDFFNKLQTKYQLDFEVLSLALAVPEDVLHQRVLARKEERDQEKLNNWQEYYQQQKQENCWDVNIELTIQPGSGNWPSQEMEEFLQVYEVL